MKKTIRHECRKFFLCFFPVFLLLSVCLSGCKKTYTPVTLTTFALDTVCQITFYDEADRAACREALDLLPSYEMIFSRTKEGAELKALNDAKGSVFNASEELYGLIEDALSFCVKSQGAFDITLGGVSDLYDFVSEAHRIPTKGALAEALIHVGYEHIHLLSDHRIQVDDPETVIDLGAIAKGYIADKLKEKLVSYNVKSALISLGGNVVCVGSRPDGEDFVIGIKKPEKNTDELIRTESLSDKTLVTSGTYERGFEKDGILYHHLLDPKTGEPVRNGYLSCSVIAESSETADALSTLCFILGPEASEGLIRAFPGVRLVFVSETGQVLEIGQN